MSTDFDNVVWAGIMKGQLSRSYTVTIAVMTIRSVKILLVCNTDFFGKLAKIGQYLVSILGKSQYIWKIRNSFFEMCISGL